MTERIQKHFDRKSQNFKTKTTRLLAKMFIINVRRSTNVTESCCATASHFIATRFFDDFRLTTMTLAGDSVDQFLFAKQTHFRQIDSRNSEY